MQPPAASSTPCPARGVFALPGEAQGGLRALWGIPAGGAGSLTLSRSSSLVSAEVSRGRPSLGLSRRVGGRGGEGGAELWAGPTAGSLGRARNEQRPQNPGWCSDRRQSFPSPSFYPRSTKSLWILCDGVFLPHGSSGGPLGVGVQGQLSPRPSKLPLPTSPIASALKVLQIPEKTEGGKLQRGSGTSRE